MASLFAATSSYASPKARKTVKAKAAATVAPAFSDAWVEDETRFEDRKQPAHATFIPYSSTASMRQDDCFRFPWLTPKHADYLLLNGKWKFHYTPDWKQGKPGEQDFYADNADVSAWGDITVPLNWAQ